MISNFQRHTVLSKQSRRVDTALAVILLVISLPLISPTVLAEGLLVDSSPDEFAPVDIRLGTSFDEVVAIKLVSFAFQAPAPHWLRADLLEFSVGAVTRAERSRPFLSLGPVWRWQPSASDKRWFVDFGVSPTLLGGAKFDGRDFGGNLQFASSLEVGRTFGHRSTSAVSLRIQRISNWPLIDSKRGVDVIGLRFSYSPGTHTR